MADDQLVNLGRAIDRALGERPRKWLADALGVHPSTISRICDGVTADLTLARVVEIENALDLDRGDLLRAAGYVAEVASFEDYVTRDKRINNQARTMLLGMYETALREEG